MKKLIFSIVALFTIVGCQGCEEPPKIYMYGTVINESGTIIDRKTIIERSEGALFGNDSIRFGDATYVIKFKGNNDKIYTIQISDYGRMYALEEAIEKGSKIRIQITKFNSFTTSVDRVSDYKVEVLD